ncbi:copper chaperone PCu(A)C [Promicromonospora sp. NPDC050880]|uniref:copper chaperone PCu(A)C n=1 Tax=Promicromonospora sp. NPDC050880 TaxID=3364406 RepID=UPI00378BF7EC
MHNLLINRPTIRRSTTSARVGALLVAATLALAGCGTAADAAPEDVAAPAGQSVTLAEGWVKAAGSGMSAAFGQLSNNGSQDVTVVSATTEASSALELHETVEGEAGEMVMREVDGGFVIPAGGTLDLAPGGSHIMLMDLAGPLRAGDEVVFTLAFSDDSTYEFTAPVKDYSGANENYVGGDDGGTDGSMDGSMDVDG